MLRPAARRVDSRLLLDAGLLLGLAAVAAALRLPPLGTEALWVDDHWIALVSRADTPAEVALLGLTAPGFAAVLGLLFAAVGFAEPVAQLPAFVAGVAGPPLLYGVARRLGVARAGAVLAAALLVVSPELVVQSTRVKQYSAEVVVGALLLLAGARVLQAPTAWRRWGVLAAAVVAGMVVSTATVVTGGAAVVAGGLGALRAAARGPRRAARDRGRALVPALVTGAALAVAVGLWALVVVLPASTDTLRFYWREHYGAEMWALGLELGSVLRVETTAALLWAAAVLVVLRDRLLAVLLVGPTLLALGLAVAGLLPFAGGRTDIHLYPSIALGVGVAADTLLRAAEWLVARVRLGVGRRAAPARRLPLLRAATLVAALVALGRLVVLAPPVRDYPEQDLAPLVALVEAEAAPGDLVLVHAQSRWGYALYTDRDVRFRRDDVAMTGFDVEVLPAPGRPEVVVLPDGVVDVLEVAVVAPALVRGAERVWLVQSHFTPELPLVRAALDEEGLRVVRSVDRTWARVTVWER